MKVYQALARSFAAEGVDTVFCVLGDGNMHWLAALVEGEGARMVHGRHEHCSVAMAMGYHSATGKVGVASVTCGPGFTQLATALTTAVRANIPMVCFAGESPTGAAWYIQAIDQAPFAVACGARYLAIRNPKLARQTVRDAFHIAQFHSTPVVVGVPIDLQEQDLADADIPPSAAHLPADLPAAPDARQIDAVAAAIRNAQRPLILAGRGVMMAGAADELVRLAVLSGARLATTLKAVGLYEGHPLSVGVAGGFASDISRETGGEADLVVAIGASLNPFTLDGGKMFPRARIIQIDRRPLGLVDAATPTAMMVRSDARLAVSALIERMEAGPALVAAWPPLGEQDRNRPADGAPFSAEPGTHDPRVFFQALAKVLPAGYDVVSGSGHQAYFHTAMPGLDPAKYHSIRDFGSIGDGLSVAIGVAAARGNGRVVLFDGDGSLLMHIQELETVQRHGLKLLIVCCNDGAYGSELHKYRQVGHGEALSIFGRPDFQSIAQGFGLAGATVDSLGQLPALMEQYERGNVATVWNVPASDRVMSPHMRSLLGMR